MTKPKKMYAEARPISSFFVGCNFKCTYCESSFQRQMKRQKKNCMLCYEYEPHRHWERFSQHPPRTRGKEFLFLCDFGDVSFASHEFMLALVGYCYTYPDRTFLVQSKDPRCFREYRFPDNVILGTTLETNVDDHAASVSGAPPISVRVRGLKKLRHPTKSVTIEPILSFDLDEFVAVIAEIGETCDRLIVYVGYDSHPKKNQLHEPTEKKTKLLIEALLSLGVDVRLKLIRKAWWE